MGTGVWAPFDGLCHQHLMQQWSFRLQTVNRFCLEPARLAGCAVTFTLCCNITAVVF